MNQAFYALASTASNIAMVRRCRVLQGEAGGMELWRLRERCFQIAGRVVRIGRTPMLWLSGSDPSPQEHGPSPQLQRKGDPRTPRVRPGPAAPRAAVAEEISPLANTPVDLGPQADHRPSALNTA